MVVEIFSPCTASEDQLRRRMLYERYGVGDFWTVHPTGRLVRVYRLGRDGRAAR
jgi:Uma2 family endonuclease